jgi:hypothetical protein
MSAWACGQKTHLHRESGNSKLKVGAGIKCHLQKEPENYLTVLTWEETVVGIKAKSMPPLLRDDKHIHESYPHL